MLSERHGESEAWVVYRGDLTVESGELTRMTLLLTYLREAGYTPKLFYVNLGAGHTLPSALTGLADIEHHDTHGSLWRDFVWAKRWLKRETTPHLFLLVSIFSTMLASTLRSYYPGASLVRSMHGVQEEGLLDVSGLRRVALAGLKAIEGWAARHCDAIVVVSEAMAHYVRTEFGYSGVTHQLPCVVDVEVFRPDEGRREALRCTWGWAEHEVGLVYCGSLRPWQCLEETTALWATLAQADPHLRFLLVTPEPEKAKALALQQGVPAERLISLSAAYEEVSSYLVAADVAFLLRRASVVNRVASPTKFGEYLACGLAVVASPGIGDLDAWLMDERLGVCFDLEASEQGLAPVASLVAHSRSREGVVRKERHRFAVEQLSSTGHLPRFREFLTLLKEPYRV